MSTTTTADRAASFIPSDKDRAVSRPAISGLFAGILLVSAYAPAFVFTMQSPISIFLTLMEYCTFSGLTAAVVEYSTSAHHIDVDEYYRLPHSPVFPYEQAFASFIGGILGGLIASPSLCFSYNGIYKLMSSACSIFTGLFLIGILPAARDRVPMGKSLKRTMISGLSVFGIIVACFFTFRHLGVTIS